MNYIGIDLGTSSVKLVLMDTAGHIIANVSKSYPIDYPKAGWSEQNPYDWYDACMEGIKELLDGQDESTVGGISFGGQMHGLVILDKNDEVIRPAILWNDGRTTKQCEYLKNNFYNKPRVKSARRSYQNIQQILHLQVSQHLRYCG